MTADGLGSGDLSRLPGRYSVPAPAGADRRLVARHPALDERGEAVIPTLAAGQVVSLDLVVVPVPPQVVSVSPADGSTGQPLASAVTVLFSEPLDPATVTSSTLTLELAAPGGGPTGVFVDGAVSLVDGLRVVFSPGRPLLPGRTFRALFAGGVADAGGAIYAGGPLVWTFSTSTDVVPGGQVHPEKFHVRVPVGGVAEIYGEPGALPGSVSGQVPWAVTPEIEGPLADPLLETFQGQADGSFSGSVGHPPDFAATLASRIWVKVFDPTGTLAAEFRVSPVRHRRRPRLRRPGRRGGQLPQRAGAGGGRAGRSFHRPTLVTVRTLAPAAVGVAPPPGLGLGAFIDLDFAGEARETLRVSVPAPADAADGARVFIGAPINLPWGRRLQLLSVGGVLTRDGQRYLSNDPSLQPEPAAGSITGGSRAGSKGAIVAAEGTGRSCATARQEGLPQCFLQSLLMEFTLRSQAVFYYEQGVEWSILTGLAQPFPIALGIAQEAIYNSLADSWVYLPVPHDWNGRFVLPVLSTEPLELVRRDTATGWELARQSYDPVGSADGVIDIGFMEGGTPVRPLLLDARPFQLFHLAAPAPNESIRLSLEIEAKADGTGAVTVAAVPGFPVSPGTTVALYDLAPTAPVDPDAQPQAPIAGPTVAVCDPDEAWSTGSMAGSDDLLVVVGPGGLEAASLDRFELQFDRPLTDLGDRPAAEVAQPDRPRTARSRRRLRRGHRRRLPEDGAGHPRAERPRQPAGDHPRRRPAQRPPLPAGDPARGDRRRQPRRHRPHLLGDGAHPLRLRHPRSAGRADVADARGLAGVRHHQRRPRPAQARQPAGGGLGDRRSGGDRRQPRLRPRGPPPPRGADRRGLRSATRALATDGHNRIFYAGLFGSIWGIKAVRLEDIRKADEPCVAPPAWAEGLPCFQGVVGSVRVAYALGSTTGTTASEWLALGTLPEGTPMKMAVLAQDEKGRTLALEDFVAAYTEGVVAPRGPQPRRRRDLHLRRAAALHPDPRPGRPARAQPAAGERAGAGGRRSGGRERAPAKRTTTATSGRPSTT